MYFIAIYYLYLSYILFYFFYVFQLYMSLIIYNWITIMGCSKHELYGTRNMLYSQKNEIGFRRSTFFTSYFIDGRVSLRKQPSLLPPHHLRRFARRNVCDTATEIPYWWRNQCLHNISGSHGDGVPNTNLFNFTFLLVDFGKVLCSSTTPAKLKCFM